MFRPFKGFADEERFYFPNTVLGADLIVSLAKMKTHHWAGATLSMKNFFGLVPGVDLWLAEEQTALYRDSASRWWR